MTAHLDVFSLLASKVLVLCPQHFWLCLSPLPTRTVRDHTQRAQMDLSVAELTAQRCTESFEFEKEHESGHSPLYVERPDHGIAAVNPGDFLLYLGGASRNGAFARLIALTWKLNTFRLLFDIVDHPKNYPIQLDYQDLHIKLLAASRGKSDATVAASEVPDGEAVLRNLKLSACFCRAGHDVTPEV